MRKKKNRLFTAISVLLILVLVIGAYFYVSYINKKKKEAEEKKSPSTIWIANFDRNKITKIDIKHDDIHLVLEKVKNKWIVNGINNPLYFDQDKIDDIAFSCAK